jgi:hypothetical protein
MLLIEEACDLIVKNRSEVLEAVSILSMVFLVGKSSGL